MNQQTQSTASQNSMANRLLLLVFASTALTTPTYGDDNEEIPKWYQIEVLVYGANNLYEEKKEIWPSQLSLKYPNDVILLKEQQDNSNAIPINPLIQQGEFSPILDPVPSRANDQENTATEQANLDDQAEFSDTASSEPQTQPSETPFVILDNEAKTLSRLARNIQKQNDLRLLTHKTWRQPLNNREQASNILITGGEKFDQHFELEGFIRLYVSRYIHINTNLWFSSFVSNVGQQTNPWPSLPALPEEVVRPKLNRFTSFNEAFTNPFTGMLDNNFSVDRTVTLQQSRRMRSNELHYIDHPLIGLVIRVTPYEAETEVEESELSAQIASP